MTRVALSVVMTVMLLAPAAGQAQDIESASYRERRERLVNELEQTQQQLAETRQSRVQLEARIDNVIAALMRDRADALLLSSEADALQQLDALLVASQDNLVAQRDRFAALGDAVRGRSGAELVVLLRADSSSTSQVVESAEITIDEAPAESRTYSAAANSALALGAVDQVYRAAVLPAPHVVTIRAMVNGVPLTETVNVAASGESVTYVQFAIRDGRLVPTTWTSRGTTPF